MKENYIFFENFIENVSSDLERGRKFCFIIGSGASVSSGIPSGRQLMSEWHDKLKEGHTDTSFSNEIGRRIEVLVGRESDDTKKQKLRSKLQKYRDLDYVPDTKSSQEDYNNIYELRFADNPIEGREYFIEKIEPLVPNVGYLELAKILCKTTSNVVITTNFDSLIEKAIRMIAHKSPFVIGHEAIAEYATDDIGKLPKVLKPHRDYLFGGFNRADEIQHLKKEWMSALQKVLKQYIPIVIGYSGTDPDMLELLSVCDCEKIYWCYRYGHSPRQELEDLVAKKHGAFVPTIDSDHVLISLTESFGLEDKKASRVRKMMEKQNLRYHMMDRSRYIAFYSELSKQSKRKVKRIGKDDQKHLQLVFGKTVDDYVRITNAPNPVIGPFFSIALLFDWSSVMNALLIINLKNEGYYARGYYELATCYFRKKNYLKAETEYLEFVARVPDEFRYLEAKAWNNLRAIAVIRKDLDRYLFYAEKYLELEPADGKIWKEYEENRKRKDKSRTSGSAT